MKLRVLVLCFALPGCFDSDDGSTSTLGATVVALRPADFLGSMPCAAGPGTVESYVATFTDVTGRGDPDAAAPFELPSSGVTSCHQAVGSAFAVAGHQYVARISAYDRPSDQLQPLTPGSPILVSKIDGSVVQPRWTSECNEPVYSVQFVTQYVRGCSLLAPAP